MSSTATSHNSRNFLRMEDRAALNLTYLAPIGRAFFALIFILSGLGHFSQNVIQYAAQQGVPAPGFLVPLSGLMAVVGGISILLGYHTRIGAALIVLFLIPVTLAMHHFWNVSDPVMAQIQQAHFLKNLALLGAALLIFRWGSGEMSMDSQSKT